MFNTIRIEYTTIFMNIYKLLEDLGEMLVGILGIDSSRYQNIIDQMSDQEKQIALAVNKQRMEEDKRCDNTVTTIESDQIDIELPTENV